jgi:hypothetical protein
LNTASNPAFSAEERPGVPRRTGKGHVDSYGDDRVCRASGCETKLSRYNSSPLCWSHRVEPT